MELEDLGFDNDEIRGFLKHELFELEANNAKITQTIKDRREHLRVFGSSSEMDNSSVRLTSTWKNIFNGKYAFGFTVHNDGIKPLRNIRAFLKWTSSKSISYEVYIFKSDTNRSLTSHNFTCNVQHCLKIPDNSIRSEEIDSLGYLVIVLDFPNFTKNLEAQISGNLAYTMGHNDRDFNLIVPTLHISPSDATNRQMSEWSLSNGIAENLQTAISCSTRTELVVVLPQEWSGKLISAFEIHCTLTTVESGPSCRKYFVARRVSSIFDNSVLEVHAPNEESPNAYYCAIYTRDRNSLIPLLHHLHQNLIGVQLLPIHFYENVLMMHCNSGSDDILKKFKESANNEMKQVEDSIETFRICQSAVKENVIGFRSDLAELEKKTDVLNLRISNQNSC